MIICNKDGVRIKGSAEGILADFANITDSVKAAFSNAGLPEKEIKENMKEAFEFGMAEDKSKEIVKALAEILEDIKKAIIKEDKENG